MRTMWTASVMVSAVMGLGILVSCQPTTNSNIPTSPTARSSDPTPLTEPATPLETIPDEDVKALVAGNNEFAIDLYKKLAEKETGNIVFSPYSISSALAMTYAGARGETAAEMRKTLHFNLSDDKLHPAFAALTSAIASSDTNDAYQLSNANALWGQAGYPFRPEFTDLTKRFYEGNFRELDFSQNANTARKVINEWVSDNTEKRIPELLTPSDIEANTVLVLTNAIYFKGKWERRFPIDGTREADFETERGEFVRVPMMHVSGDFRYSMGPDVQAIELPYQGGRLSMILLLPVKRYALAEFEDSLNTKSLGAIMSSLASHAVELFLPRFKSNSRFELKNNLESLGMPRAFSAQAEFQKIASSSLQIKDVIHGADITVDEKGTEATAATAVIMVRSARRPAVFRADAPFLFMIVDRPTGSVLFLGRNTGL